ncbi:MAG: hypothetical protein WCY23_00995 [Candidatus Omnitrophota bacterium]
MAKEICFFMQTPLTKRDHERFGLEILKSRGFKVSFLDMTRILNPAYAKKYEPPDPSDYDGIVAINTWRDLSKYLKENPIYLGVDLICSGKNNIFMYNALKKYNIKYASVHVNRTPDSPTGGEGRRTDFGQKLRRIRGCLKDRDIVKNAKEIMERLMLSLYSSNIQKPAVIIKGGRADSFRFPGAAKGAQVINAHTLDYDLYLKRRTNDTGSAPKNDYMVFLDEYNPFHPDMITEGDAGLWLDPEDYYGGLTRFFSYIEGKTGLPVKIAAHPRSRYDLHPDYFKGRDVIMGKTIELVSGAKAVLAHASTSINFAVLYKKPIIFLTSNGIKKTSYDASIGNFARQFNKKPVNVDGNLTIDLEAELLADESAYDRYRADYIKSPGSPEKLCWEIVADNIGPSA